MKSLFLTLCWLKNPKSCWCQYSDNEVKKIRCSKAHPIERKLRIVVSEGTSSSNISKSSSNSTLDSTRKTRHRLGASTCRRPDAVSWLRGIFEKRLILGVLWNKGNEKYVDKWHFLAFFRWRSGEARRREHLDNNERQRRDVALNAYNSPSSPKKYTYFLHYWRGFL